MPPAKARVEESAEAVAGERGMSAAEQTEEVEIAAVTGVVAEEEKGRGQP